MAKKKSRQQEAIDAGQTLQQNITDAGQQYQNTIQQAGQAYQQGLDNIANNYQNSANDAMSSVQRANEAAERDFTDIAQDIKNQYDEAQRENAIRSRADLNSAKYAGVTELASSIANLIGVGALGASNQTYQNYSQNWMQRADQERRARQARMDNIRERERQQRAQIAQLRQGGANALAQMRLGQAGTVAGLRGNALQAGYQSGRDAAQAGYQAGTAAAQAGYQGTLQGLQLGMQEENAQASRGLQAAALAQRDRQFNAQMEAKGYDYDPKTGKWNPNPEKMATIATASGRSGRGGSNSNNSYTIIDANGNMNVAHMKSDEKKALLSGAVSDIESDLGEEEAKKFQSEYQMADSDSERNAIIEKWMGKSPRVEARIRAVDPTYRGNHTRAAQENPYAGKNKNSIDAEFGL